MMLSACFLFPNHSVFLKKRKDGRIKREIRPMKKHSFLSYLFWTATAVLIGTTASSATAAAAKTARRYIASAGTTFIYAAAPLPYSVIKKATAKKPSLSAEGYLAADIQTGEIILEKNKSKQFPMASITKLMTALVSLETIDQSQVAIVPPEALVGENPSIRGLSEGEVISTSSLLYPLLLESSNDAAEALAEHFDRDSFIAKMNLQAEKLKMEKVCGMSLITASWAEFSTARVMRKAAKMVINQTIAAIRFQCVTNVLRLKILALIKIR